jgi:predicted N-acyltransferase
LSLKASIQELSDSTLTGTVHSSAAEIPAADWNSLVPSTDGRIDNPFLDHAFFVALEASGCATSRTGWAPRHIVLRNEAEEAVGLMPLYEKTHSQGEYVFDYGWANAFEQAGGQYYPKLQCSVPFTPVTTPKLLARANDPAIENALITAAETLAERRGISSIHATFMPESEAARAEKAGWLQRSDTQYHWHNHAFESFDQYLETMSSRHRKSTRRERRDATEGLTVRWITGADLNEDIWDAFFEFYQDTGTRKWGRPYLNRRFFSLLSAAMADRILLIFAYDGDRPIAGTLNMIGTDTLYGRYWGATENIPFLHFELCYYQSIDYAIAHKLKRVEAGAQGEHKLARGYAPATMHSAHWIGHPGLRQAIERFLEAERASVEREQEALSEFTPFKKVD